MRANRKGISARVVLGLFLGILFFPSPAVMANEPVVAIQVLTDEVVPGKDIQIQLTIAHGANNFLHHVEWVDLVVNEQQSNRWAYSAFDLPPAATFKKVVTYRVPPVEEIRIVAEASCLRHGSSGKISILVPVKK